MPKHTPTPWEIVVRKQRKGGPIYQIRQAKSRYPKSCIAANAKILIGELYSHRFGSCDNVPGDGPNDLADADKEGCQQANAEFIVRAVNSHADLLEALKEILPHAEKAIAQLNAGMCGSLYPAINDAKIERARAAIQKAQS